MKFNLPSGIPQNPAEVYGDKWQGWNDWLGTPEHAFLSEQAAAAGCTIHECIECFKLSDESPGLWLAECETAKERWELEKHICLWRKMIRRYESIERDEIPLKARNASQPEQRDRSSQDDTN